MFGNLEKSKRTNVFLSPYFYVLAIVFSVTIWLSLMGSFKGYQSEISILVIPKNESASFQADQVIENLIDITHRLSFYDRVLFDNPNIQDPFAGLSKDQRKEQWNKSFRIERMPNSTTVNIFVFNSNSNESAKIAKQTAFSLFGVASKFYNIKTDLDLRIIEGPITSSYLRGWYWLTLISLLLGTVLSAIFIYLGRLSPVNIFQKMNSLEIETGLFRDRSEALDGKGLFHPFHNEKNVPEEEFVARKAAAPDNLPIASELEEPQLEPYFSTETDLSQSEEKISENGEPTDEEYRERLNKLLRGEL